MNIKSNKNNLQILIDNISKWSNNTFGINQKNPAIIFKLKDEVLELIESFIIYNSNFKKNSNEKQISFLNVLNEFSDCFILLFDSASRFGLSANTIIEIVRKKLEINKKRKWFSSGSIGKFQHIPKKNIDTSNSIYNNGDITINFENVVKIKHDWHFSDLIDTDNYRIIFIFLKNSFLHNSLIRCNNIRLEKKEADDFINQYCFYRLNNSSK